MLARFNFSLNLFLLSKLENTKHYMNFFGEISKMSILNVSGEIFLIGPEKDLTVTYHEDGRRDFSLTSKVKQ